MRTTSILALLAAAIITAACEPPAAPTPLKQAPTPAERVATGTATVTFICAPTDHLPPCDK